MFVFLFVFLFDEFNIYSGVIIRFFLGFCVTLTHDTLNKDFMVVKIINSLVRYTFYLINTVIFFFLVSFSGLCCPQQLYTKLSHFPHIQRLQTPLDDLF